MRNGHFGNDPYGKRPFWEWLLWETALMGNGHFGNGPYGKRPFWEMAILGTPRMGTAILGLAILGTALMETALMGNDPYGKRTFWERPFWERSFWKPFLVYSTTIIGKNVFIFPPDMQEINIGFATVKRPNQCKYVLIIIQPISSCIQIDLFIFDAIIHYI